MLIFSLFILITMLIVSIILAYKQKDYFSKLLVVNLAGNIGLAVVLCKFVISGSILYLDIAIVYGLCTPIATIVISRFIKWI